MALSEFDLIEKYFRRSSLREDVALGVGDDAALLRVPEGMLLASAVDTMIAGVHFPEQTMPADIGWKVLAINLSDLAAMGAEPAWVTLSLSMPAASERYVEEFADGFFQLAERYSVELVGGDTVKGPVVVTVQANGFVEESSALTRYGARPGDGIYVSGTLGDAAAGLKLVLADELPRNPDQAFLRERLDRPVPRIELGRALHGIATACIDISDGLSADLGHLMEKSGLGAAIETANLPLSTPLLNTLEREEAVNLALSGGDDYELCFCVPMQLEERLLEAVAGLDVAVTRIGEMTNEVGVLRIDGEARPLKGYDHFQDET